MAYRSLLAVWLGGASSSPLPVIGPVYVFTIAGVERIWKAGTLRIQETANGRNTLSCDILSLTGVYRPQIGDEVVLTEDGVRLFAGNIDTPSEQGFFSHGGTAITTRISAVDFNALVDRRVVSATRSQETLLARLTWLVTYLAPYSVTLHPSQAIGDLVAAVTYEGRRPRDILDELSVQTGYTWELDYNKQLRMLQPGTVTAPVATVTDSNGVAIGDITVSKSRVEYANSINLLVGSGVKEVTETFIGDGVTRTFPLRVAMAGFPVVSINGVYYHTDPYSGPGGIFPIAYDSTANSIIHREEAPPGTPWPVLTSSDTLTVVYPGQHPYQIQVTTSPPPAAGDLIEEIIAEPDIFDPVVAQAVAEGHLQRKSQTTKTVRYQTFTTGYKPGHIQTITVLDRQLTGTHLITDVETSDTVDHRLARILTLVDGTTYPGSWRDNYRQGISQPGSAATSVTVVQSQGAPVYFLGGSEVLYVQDPTPTWKAADAVRITIDSVARGNLTAIARVRVRATAGSVTPRIFNVTDATAAGTGTLITSTAWVDQFFPVTLTAGVKTYEMQVLPSLANTDVAAVGFLE